MANSELVQSLLRGLDLLKLISTHQEGIRLNELAEATGMKKPTIHNLLRTLAARGFVVKDNVNRFRVGPGVFEIVSAQHSADRRKYAVQELQKLARKFPDCVITLSAISNADITCLLRVSPDNPGVIQHPENHKFMPYISASAVVLQAANPQKAQHLETIYPFEEFGIGMWGAVERFREIIRKVAQERWYSRIVSGYYTIACAMPDGYALGFKSPAGGVFDNKTYLGAAEDFRAAVWGK